MIEDAKSTRQRGDLANRIVRRRQELGLTHEQLAKLAHVDAGYPEYLEQTWVETPNADLLMRLANALQTTPMSLAGGDVGRAPGPGRPGPHPAFEALTDEQCVEHLLPGGIGRVVFVAERGPSAFPVNFRFARRSSRLPDRSHSLDHCCLRVGGGL